MRKAPFYALTVLIASVTTAFLVTVAVLYLPMGEQRQLIANGGPDNQSEVPSGLAERSEHIELPTRNLNGRAGPAPPSEPLPVPVSSETRGEAFSQPEPVGTIAPPFAERTGELRIGAIAESVAELPSLGGRDGQDAQRQAAIADEPASAVTDEGNAAPPLPVAVAASPGPAPPPPAHPQDISVQETVASVAPADPPPAASYAPAQTPAPAQSRAPAQALAPAQTRAPNRDDGAGAASRPSSAARIPTGSVQAIPKARRAKIEARIKTQRARKSVRLEPRWSKRLRSADRRILRALRRPHAIVVVRGGPPGYAPMGGRQGAILIVVERRR